MLNSLGSNVRPDYAGECIDGTNMSMEDICNEAVQGRRCQYNASNCDALAQPQDGCCPICGKAVEKDGCCSKGHCVVLTHLF